MKKLFLSCCFALLGTSAALAQAELRNNPQAASQVRFRANSAENSGIGVKGGVNFADINGGGVDKRFKDQKGLVQYHFGAYVQMGITNWFSIQPELLYQRKGYKAQEQLLDAAGADSTGSGKTIKLSYLSAPILLVFNPFANVAVQVGPQFSYLLNVREGSDQVDAQAYHYKGFDMGLVGGVEAKLEFLRLGVRYDYSLTDLRKAGNFTVSNVARRADADIRNSTFQVYLGLGL